MSKWFIRNKQPIEDVDYLSLGISEVEYKILLNRDINTPQKIREFLHPGAEFLHSPILLSGMIKAGNVIREALSRGKRIRIVGDYDVDGVMSTSILLLGLRKLGGQVDFVIPHRVKDGYGINKRIVEEAANDKIQLIITCDNGISAHESIIHAKELGMDVIVTDHHEVPRVVEGQKEIDNIPKADAVINPKQEICQYPFKNLSGGSVAYKLIEHLYTIFGKIEELDPDLLAFAAISTVCDVMILLEENRSILSLGLEALNTTNNLGLISLKKACNIKGPIETYHLGFIIGPTINSAGRLDTAEKAVELFISNNPTETDEISKFLRDLNRDRQEMTDDALLRIEEQIEEIDLDREKILLLYDTSIHESIAGIIAGRIKSKYNRPTIILAKSKGILKGSGRSIEGFNITQEIRRHSDLLINFGGHPMACGLSLKEENFLEFKTRLLENLDLSNDSLVPIIRLDAPYQPSLIKMDLIKRLNKFAPFGSGNERPIFGAKGLTIESIQLLGEKKNVLRITFMDGRTSIKGILFKDALDSYNTLNRYKQNLVDILYVPKINVFRGQASIQLEIEDFRISEMKR